MSLDVVTWLDTLNQRAVDGAASPNDGSNIVIMLISSPSLVLSPSTLISPVSIADFRLT